MYRLVSLFLASCGVLFSGNAFVLPELGGLVRPMALHAQSVLDQEPIPEDPRPPRMVPTLSESWLEQQQPVTKLWNDEKDLEKVGDLLDQMFETSADWSRAEIATFHQRYAQLGFDLGNMDIVVEHLKNMLNFRDIMAYTVEEEVLMLLARVYSLRIEDHDIALEYAQEWLDLKLNWAEDSHSYAFIGSVYGHREDWVQVLHWYERAITKQQEVLKDGQKVNVTWWRALVQAHTNLFKESDESSIARQHHIAKVVELEEFLSREYGLRIGNPVLLDSVSPRYPD